MTPGVDVTPVCTGMTLEGGCNGRNGEMTEACTGTRMECVPGHISATNSSTCLRLNLLGFQYGKMRFDIEFAEFPDDASDNRENLQKS